MPCTRLASFLNVKSLYIVTLSSLPVTISSACSNCGDITSSIVAFTCYSDLWHRKHN